jgi:hypothetical protein
MLHINFIPQAPAQNDASDSHHYPTFKIWQICLVMVLISIAVHLAVQHLADLVKPATAWLIQALAAWCNVHGDVVDTTTSDRVANQTSV